jgi:NADH:ubiquinone oxidoreductase subunit H
MPVAAVAVAVVVIALLLASVALLWQRRRLAKRFARRISPFAKQQTISGQVLDPEDWNRR